MHHPAINHLGCKSQKWPNKLLLKKQSILVTATLFLLGIATMQSCKRHCHDPKNPKCENYDPCFGKRTINTHFIVQEGSGATFEPLPQYAVVPCDTLAGVSARFIVPQNNPDDCHYSWEIGTTSTVYTESDFYLSFSAWLQQGHWMEPIPITLTIRRSNSACLEKPSDTLIKITRNIWFTQNIINWTSFEGYYENSPNTKLTITKIDCKGGNFRGVDFGSNGSYSLWVGLPTNDTFVWESDGWPNGSNYYKGWKISSKGSSGRDVNGWLDYSEAYFINEDSVKATFRFFAPNNKNTYVFHGKRLK